jgi:glycosyltransferase involved in cell wall biosynthesis
MVAGMSNVCMPRYLRARFVNLSNGIDTDFFNPELTARSIEPVKKPLLILPARIVKSKGHMDLLKILYRLKKHGLNCSLVFAGRHESSELKSQLDGFIQRHHLETMSCLLVHFHPNHCASGMPKAL